MSNPGITDEEYLRRYAVWCDCKGSTKRAVEEYFRRHGIRLSEDTMRRSVKEARRIHGTKIDDFASGPPAPDGYKVKGVSTLYDAEGERKLEWVKIDADRKRQEELFREMIKALVSDLPRLPLIDPPEYDEEHLLACYPVGDHHNGMFSWHEETGADYDIKIAETILMRAMDYLLSATPASKHALIPVLGDFTHHDGYEPVTPTNKNQLDTDSRFPKIIRVALRSIRYLVERAAQKHEIVTLVIIPGNHDPATSIFLMEALANIYEDNPRIKVDTSPALFHYFHFGKCLFGMYHGHRVKLENLPMIMATDQPDMWGKTEFRYWLTGHIHKDSAKDLVGCKVESLRVLASPDAWGTGEGYRPMRDMKAIVYHKDHGEKARHTVNPGMLK